MIVLTGEYAAIMLALSGFTDYVPANSVHSSAFGKATTPSIEGTARRLVTLYKRGFVSRSKRDGKWKYAITDAGREWLRDATQPTGQGGE